jgi:hypothetical protein
MQAGVKKRLSGEMMVKKLRGRRREVRAKRIDISADDRKSVRIDLDPKANPFDRVGLPDVWTSVSPTPSVFTLNRGFPFADSVKVCKRRRRL